MHGGTQRNVTQRQRVTQLDRRIFAGLDTVFRLQAFGGQNITTLTVQVLDQRNVRGTVRIVFQTLNNAYHTIFVTTEVNQTVFLLVTTTFMTGSNATIVVTTTVFALGFQQRRVGSTFMQIFVDHLDYKAAARRSRLALYNRHYSLLPSLLCAQEVNVLAFL